MKVILSRPGLNHHQKTEVDRNGNQHRRPFIDLIMICRRCGQCCFHLDIFVVNPRSILPDGTINSDDPDAMIFKPARQRCPHLVVEGDRSRLHCHLHHPPPALLPGNALRAVRADRPRRRSMHNERILPEEMRPVSCQKVAATKWYALRSIPLFAISCG